MPSAEPELDSRTSVALLGDGRYNIIVTSAGAGISRAGELVINRWRNDATRDAYGQWCYLRDLTTDRTWSAGHQPLCAQYDEYEATLSGSSALINRRDAGVRTRTEIVALPDGGGEARRITITNEGDTPKTIELTSYQEVVLAPQINDRGHRAFSNLFVQTEWVPGAKAILAMRRPRSATETPSWCGHALATDHTGTVSFETDRARFLGRGRSSRNPVAMETPGNLTGSVGAVLDPVFALRLNLLVPPQSSRAAVFSTFPAATRVDALERTALLSSRATVDALIADAQAAGDTVARNLGLDEEQAQHLARLVPRILHGSGRASAGTRDDLLRLGITGEHPIVMARLSGEQREPENLRVVRDYLGAKGIAFDLVVVCEGAALAESVRAALGPADDAGGGRTAVTLVLTAGDVAPADMSLLESVSRVAVR